MPTTDSDSRIKAVIILLANRDSSNCLEHVALKFHHDIRASVEDWSWIKQRIIREIQDEVEDLLYAPQSEIH